MGKKGLLYNSSIILGAQIFGKIISFFTVILLARKFGVVKFGEFSYFISLGLFLTIFIDLGATQFIIKDISAKKVDENKIFIHSILLKCLHFVVVYLILYFFFGRAYLDRFSILILYPLFDSLIQSTIAIYNGKHEFRNVSKVLFSMELFRSLGLFLLSFFTVNIKVFYSVYTINSFVFFVFLLTLRINSGMSFRIQKSYVKHYYKSVIWFFIYAIAYQLYFRIDVLLIERLSSDKLQLGLYNVAYKLFEIFLLAPAALMGVVFPKISSLVSQNKLGVLRIYLRRIQYYLVLIFLIIVLIASTYASDIITILYGKAFEGAAHILVVLMFTLAIYLFNCIYSVSLNSSGNEKFSVLIFAVGSIVNIVLNFLFIPKFGGVGAAYATLIAEILSTALYVYIFNKKIIYFILHSNILKFLFAFLILYLFSRYFIASINFYVGIPLLTILYLGLFYFSAKNQIHYLIKYKLKQNV